MNQENFTVDNEAVNQLNEEKVQESKENSTSENSTENQSAGQHVDIDQLKAEYEAKINELNDKYLRIYSEFDNYKKRVSKERSDLIREAGKEIVTVLLPVLDDFERAIKQNESTEDIALVKEGFTLIQHKMNDMLSKKGLKKMEAYGVEFNPDLHEALTKIPAPNEEMKDKVVDVIEHGYYLNDKLIRFAKVVVGN
jgi:molecular chaperone GrpE